MLPKLGCFWPTPRGFAIISRLDRRSLLGARDAPVAFLDLSVVLGRRTFNRVVEARAAVRPTVQAPRRVLRIWGHWAHLLTTAHRGRSSDCGFVAQFLWLRKSVRTSEPGRFRTVFWACLHFLAPCVWEANNSTHKVVLTALSPFKHSKQKVASQRSPVGSGTIFWACLHF